MTPERRAMGILYKRQILYIHYSTFIRSPREENRLRMEGTQASGCGQLSTSVLVCVSARRFRRLRSDLIAQSGT